MQTSAESLNEMGLEDPNEIVGSELAEVTIDEDAQRQSEIERAAERKRKRELAKERERREKEIAEDCEQEERAYASLPPKYDLSPGTIEQLQQDVRLRGMKLRRNLNVSLKDDKQKWQALRRPCCLQAANMTLDEMLTYIPKAEQEQFHEIGDVYVYMPLFTMEKYLFPTLHRTSCGTCMSSQHKSFRRSRVDDCILLLQSRNAPAKEQRQYDLDVLRNSTFSAGRDIPQQLQSNAEVTEGISSHLRLTLRQLREATTLPDLNQLNGYDQAQLDERQAEIDALIKI